MFEKASRLKLRFLTTKGSLSVEQLWDLSLSTLSDFIKDLKKHLVEASDDDLSFLEETTTIDSAAQFRFNILKHIYITKKNEMVKAAQNLETKQHNQKIMELIAQKKNSELSNMSIEELEKLIK